MDQPFAKEINMIAIEKLFRKWKWVLLFCGLFSLGVAIAFVLVKSNTNFALDIMLPKQIDFSFNDKDIFNLSARNLNKNEYERMSLFFFNRDLFSRYLRETLGKYKGNQNKPFNLQSMIIPKFVVDFSNAAVRNEALQYLLFKSERDSGLNADAIGKFVLNIFKNYYLLEGFREYYNSLQIANVKALGNRRMLLDGIKKISMRIAKLREQKKKYPGIIYSRGNFLLQINGENERYLELAQQLTANEILSNETKNELEINQKRITRTRFLIEFVNGLRQKQMEALYSDPDQSKRKLLKVQKEFTDKELIQEFQKLMGLYDLVNFNFKVFHGDPLLLKDDYLHLKALVIFIFTFGMLLLVILVLEFGRKNRT